ncbi:hypothetical protein MFLO_16145, partial [Listeria floridensis FSL S10-1187]
MFKQVFKFDASGVFERDDLYFCEDNEVMPAGYTTIAP